MTLSQFTSKLNWRLMVVHLVAYWFLWEAAEYFAVLYDYHFLTNFLQQHHFSEPITNAELRSLSMNDYERLSDHRMVVAIFPLLGVVVALILSLVISFVKKWYWLNSAIGFILVLSLTAFWSLNHIKITPWTYLKYIFKTPGYFFRGSMGYFIVNGFVLLAIGLCLFFLKPVTRFIAGKKVTTPANNHFELKTEN